MSRPPWSTLNRTRLRSRGDRCAGSGGRFAGPDPAPCGLRQRGLRVRVGPTLGPRPSVRGDGPDDAVRHRAGGAARDSKQPDRRSPVLRAIRRSALSSRPIGRRSGPLQHRCRGARVTDTRRSNALKMPKSRPEGAGVGMTEKRRHDMGTGGRLGVRRGFDLGPRSPWSDHLSGVTGGCKGEMAAIIPGAPILRSCRNGIYGSPIPGAETMETTPTFDRPSQIGHWLIAAGAE